MPKGKAESLKNHHTEGNCVVDEDENEQHANDCAIKALDPGSVDIRPALLYLGLRVEPVLYGCVYGPRRRQGTLWS